MPEVGVVTLKSEPLQITTELLAAQVLIALQKFVLR